MRSVFYPIVFLVILVLSLPTRGLAAVVQDMRLSRTADRTTLVFDLNQPVQHKLVSQSNPRILNIDLMGTSQRANPSRLSLANTPISRIQSTAQGRDLRIVLELKNEVREKSYLLKKQGKYRDRLVVELYDRATPVAVKSMNDQGQRDIVVAIDAGHGGQDPGAIGPGKVQEKRVTMAIAKELEALLRQTRGYRPVQVRSGDRFVSLSGRREIARQKKADLFVSIHADAFSTPDAKGSSVYVLSQSGASSAAARFLADSENNSDKLGGVELSEADAQLSEVLVDLSMTYKLEASVELGQHVLGQMRSVSRLHSRQVEKAGFAVLKTPDIPSILVETGFISNPEEARKLNTPAYQKQMARAIHQGINRFFAKRAPEGTYIAALNRKRPQEYVIGRGETLSEIAKRYRVSVETLRLHNGLKSTQVQAGQRIRIPSS